MTQESLEWHSLLHPLRGTSAEEVRATLGEGGLVAYTDGACSKNPGGPAGWSVILVSVAYVNGEHRDPNAPRIECYGHIPRAPGTTNNRAEIAAVLAALCLTPHDQLLTIHSDSEYTIKFVQGAFKKMKVNLDLRDLYHVLLKKRAVPPTFAWVHGHAGQVHNERADELPGWALEWRRRGISPRRVRHE